VTHALPPARINKKKGKNETLHHVPSHGHSPIPCLRLSLAEICLCSCDAVVVENSKSLVEEIADDNTKDKT
jgi:hypothetical protein